LLLRVDESGEQTVGHGTDTFSFALVESRARDQQAESVQLRHTMAKIEQEIERRVDYAQFERICDELQRALDREKQAQDLLNEQNQQLKTLTEILHATQHDNEFLQQKFHQLTQNDKHSKEKIQQLNKSHQQMDDNVKRAEKAIRLVVR
jgi:uncharacterized phage infection (PIP) family protein YhgE